MLFVTPNQQCHSNKGKSTEGKYCQTLLSSAEIILVNYNYLNQEKAKYQAGDVMVAAVVQFYLFNGIHHSI